MIGISIHADSIRAVRLTKSRKQFVVKDCYMKDLFEGDIIQGRLVNADSFQEALLDIKTQLDISDTEEIHIGLPDGVFKIDNAKYHSDVYSKEQFLSEIQLLGNKNSFNIDFPFISPNVKVELKQDYETAERDEEGNVIPKYGSFKKVSYIAIQKEDLQNYVDVFTRAELNIVSIEPNAIAIAKYLKDDASQPFLVLNIEYDYTSMIVFSEEDGVFLLNASDLGSKYLTNVEYDEFDEPVNVSINNRNLKQLSNRIKLAIEYYEGSSIFKEGNSVKQLVVMNEQYPFIEDILERDFPELESLSAHDMLPEGISTKFGKNVNYEDLFLYYIAMVVAMNKNENVFKNNSAERKIGVNILPNSAQATANYKRVKVLTTKVMSVLAGLAGLYFVGTLGINGLSYYQVSGDGETVTEKKRSQYEDAKKQNTTMKENIVKYNTVSAHKHNMSPIIDKLIANKPASVRFSNINMSYKSKKAVIECVSEDMISPNELLDAIRQNQELAQAQILSTQTKNGKVAFQIVVPLL